MTSQALDASDLRVETTTIMFADVVESVRIIEQDELVGVTRIRHLLGTLCSDVISPHLGTLIERRGDGLIVRFETGSAAVRCANAMHAFVLQSQRDSSLRETLALRIGLHHGLFLSDGVAHYGTAMNVAARMTALCEPGETVATENVRAGLAAEVDCDVEDLGERYLKNLQQPLRAFRLSAVNATAAEKPALPVPEVRRATIAVLPFEIRGTPEEESSLCELICESVAHHLARADQLDVISWRSSRSLASLSAQEAAAKLAADWVIVGSCNADRERLNISIELQASHTPAIAWALRLTTDVRDLLATESEAMQEFVASLSQRLSEIEAKKLTQHSLPTLSSHSLLTGAIGLMHRGGRENFDRSRNALEFLADRHPRMHAVQPWLAQWYVLKNTRGFANAPSEDASRALSHTARALDALPEDPRALALLGFVHFHLLQDPAVAIKHLEASIKIDANDPLAVTFCAAVRATIDRDNEAWKLSLRALRIAPFDPLRDYIRAIAAGCALTARETNVAIALARSSIRENAAHPYPWRVLLIASAMAGDIPAAKAAFRKLDSLGVRLTISAYAARSKLHSIDLQAALSALREVGVPE